MRDARPIVATSAFPKGTVMQLLRTTLVSALLGVSMASFAAVSNTAASDPDAREARMQEALQNYYAKHEAMTETSTSQAKSVHHAKHHRHAMKRTTKKSQDESTTTTTTKKTTTTKEKTQ
jgi:phage I-like protein